MARIAWALLLAFTVWCPHPTHPGAVGEATSCRPHKWYGVAWAAANQSGARPTTFKSHCPAQTCDNIVGVHRIQDWSNRSGETLADRVSAALNATRTLPAGQHAILDWGLYREAGGHGIELHPADNLLSPAEAAACRGANFSGLWKAPCPCPCPCPCLSCAFQADGSVVAGGTTAPGRWPPSTARSSPPSSRAGA